MRTQQERRLGISRASALAIFLTLIVAIGGGIYHISTSSVPSSSSVSATIGTLSIDEPFWPVGDLNQFTNPYPNWQMYTVYQPLVTINGSLQQQTGAIQYLPALAENWTISQDQKTFTFNLRSVNFSNGDPFNAYQLWGQLYGLYYLSANSSYWWNGYPIFNMSAVNFGPTTMSMMNQSGLMSPSPELLSVMQNTTWPIYVTGPHQIIFQLESPFQFFIGTTIADVGLVFDTQWVLDHGGFGTPAQINTYFDQNPIPGTGPYVVSSVSEQSYVKFTQSPSYWGANLTAAQIEANPYLDPGHVRNVVITVRPDDVVRYTDLSTGQASIAAIESTDWSLVTSNADKFGIAELPPNPALVIGISMNTHRYPTNITAVRLAIEHAVDITAINDEVYHGTLSPWVGPEYPTFKDFYDLGNFPGYQYNVTLSKQILAQAEIDVSKLPTLEFRVLAGCTNCISAAEIVQADLAQIGISVDVEATPSSMYAAPQIAGWLSYSADLNLSSQESQLTWLGSATWGPTSLTPLDILLTDVNDNAAGGNYAIYGNPVVQTCVDGFFSVTSETQLQSLCLQAQQEVNDDAPYIWVGTPTLPLGSGSIAYDRAVISGFLIDPLYTGQTDTAIFNTVTFV